MRTTRNVTGKAKAPARSVAKKPAARSAAAKKAAVSRSASAKSSRTAEALRELRRDTQSLSERADRLLERLG